ncbi:mitogen-activated protein kinase kinase kinase NPK1-like [Impatiens glandulifera]|uniref:mitogen-activated protein kinase kinase kinase NPK1-like n=1 Tax=Impatiens glandulifera TaxID=253017 RepID=UPI001FB177EC|nr:mitogen-activated protein kinase kinase kinase NPK1-like [Impatiens glandulifera]
MAPMQDFIGSVRRSLVFKPSNGEDGGGFGGFVDKIGSSIRKSRIGLFSRTGKIDSYKMKKNDTPLIRWRKGELIGSGAFGRVYMGMNLDSGELIAVKQVLIPVNGASKEKAQAHIKELEEEVKLLKNLKHPNIVRYLGTGRDDESLNILLEFVPGGSISSLLGNLGPFPEPVIRMYTKQLLLGLEYLHDNGIMHRDIKGANVLVHENGIIKLADFGASKKVVELATITGTKSMKGTPYWMAPEVILQTGHSFSADIWSVGCTVIEMATGKPPWSQQYQEVAALFHIGTTKSHPPIPEHLSLDAKDFLLKCLHKEPNMRPSALDLLKHPFFTREHQETPLLLHSVVMENIGKQMGTSSISLKNSVTCMGLDATQNSMRCSSIYPEKFMGNGSIWKSSNGDDDMCRIDDDLLVGGASSNFDSPLIYKSFNPILEPNDDWPSEIDRNRDFGRSQMDLLVSQTINNRPATSCNTVNENDDEELKSKEMYKRIENKENISNNLHLPPKSRWSSKRSQPTLVCDVHQEHINPSISFSERQRRWREELDEELKRKRELMRQVSMGRTSSSSPKNHSVNRLKGRSRLELVDK